LVRSVLRHILVADNFLNPNELYLPEFKEQTNHLIQQISDSYTGGKFLLLEGSKGNGKGYALRAWAKKEKRVCIYLGLKQSFRKANANAHIPSHDISSSIDPYASPKTDTPKSNKSKSTSTPKDNKKDNKKNSIAIPNDKLTKIDVKITVIVRMINNKAKINFLILFSLLLTLSILASLSSSFFFSSNSFSFLFCA